MLELPSTGFINSGNLRLPFLSSSSVYRCGTLNPCSSIYLCVLSLFLQTLMTGRSDTKSFACVSFSIFSLSAASRRSSVSIVGTIRDMFSSLQTSITASVYLPESMRGTSLYLSAKYSAGAVSEQSTATTLPEIPSSFAAFLKHFISSTLLPALRTSTLISAISSFPRRLLFTLEEVHRRGPLGAYSLSLQYI